MADEGIRGEVQRAQANANRSTDTAAISHTAPALVFVACLMARALADVPWADPTEAIPAVVLAVTIPFTFSIATGIGLGFVVHVVVKTAAGRAREVAGAVWLIAAVSVLRFAFA